MQVYVTKVNYIEKPSISFTVQHFNSVCIGKRDRKCSYSAATFSQYIFSLFFFLKIIVCPADSGPSTMLSHHHLCITTNAIVTS